MARRRSECEGGLIPTIVRSDIFRALPSAKGLPNSEADWPMVVVAACSIVDE